MKVLCEASSHWISFPDDLRNVQHDFKAKYRFPDVIGAIDCTHMKIDSVGGNNSEIFRNRKGYFSINVQAVCGPNLYFYYVVSRWPGSTHDRRIFENSSLNSMLENTASRGHLLGDSGYSLKTYLFTPFGDPNSQRRRRYNKKN